MKKKKKFFKILAETGFLILFWFFNLIFHKIKCANYTYIYLLNHDCLKKTETVFNFKNLSTRTAACVEDKKENMTTNDHEKASVFNDFFSSVFTLEPKGTLSFESRTEVQIEDLQVTVDMIAKKLKSVNPTKSPGPDNIHPRVLKELSDELSIPLQIVFESSLEDGEIPDDWREASISAIFKKGKRSLASNYRPVSLTSTICKIFETLIRDHIIKHMDSEDLFSNRQFGFMGGRSTSLQLLRVLEDWTKILDEGGLIDCIYMDFMKAFDKVPHRRLLEKIKSYGIKGQIYEWITAFLRDRKQRVNVNGSKSDWSEVLSGIPQGSVLGPLLFVIYINDLPDMSTHSTTYLFADDTKIYNRINSIEDCTELQRDVTGLEEWSNEWLLRFHPEKCKVLRIGRNHPEFDYQLHNTILEEVEEEKDIGVVVDDQLRFHKHISEKVTKANNVMGIIRRSFTHLNEEIFLKLYKALVRPHLEYAAVVWSPTYKKYIKSIESVQRRATKQIPGMSDLSYEERLQKLRLPTLVYRRARGDMIDTYKILQGIYDNKVSSLFTRHETARTQTRGHSKKLFKSHSKLNLRKHFFTNRVINLWNNLPEKVVSAPSLNSFKNRLDSFWQNQEAKYNFEKEMVPQTTRNRTNVNKTQDSTDLDTEAKA